MKYRLFLMMATFVGLGSINTSCSRDNEPVASDGDQKAPISFNVNIGTLPTPTVTTRGYTTNSSESGYTFNGDEYVAIGLTHPSGSEVIKQYLVGAGNSGGNSLTYKKEADGTTTGYTFDWHSTTETGVSIRAWSDGVSTAASTPVVDPDGHTFTVEMTQSGNVKELLYSPAASYSYTTSAINIPLYHQLSRIVVTIIRENTSNAISSVTIGHDSDGNRVPITGTFTKPGSATNYGSWSVASEATQSTHWNVITPKAETAGSVYSAVVIPTTYAVGLRLFNITIGTQTFAYKVPMGGKTFEAGKQYNYTITVGNKGITVTSNITDWTDAVNGTDFAHGDGLAVLKNVKMNPLWYVAEGYMTNSAVGSSATLTMGTGNTGYFYTWANAMQTFAAQNSTYTDYKTAGKTISGQDGTWHMPVKGEVLSLLPYESNMFALNSDANDIYTTNNVIFGYNSETKTGITDNFYWKNLGSSKGRAIRFLNSEYCSAWEYEMNTATSPNTLTITSCLIGWVDNTKSAASAVYNEIDWANLSSYGTAVQRVFYARGYKDYGTSSTADSYQTTCIAYWSATYSYTESSPGWGDGSWGFECFSHSGYGLFTCKSLRQSAGMNVCMFRDN